MSTDSSSPASVPGEIIYAIAYQQFAGSVYNQDLRGKGTLTIRPDRSSYVFMGKARPFFLFGRVQELSFTPGQIRNVVVEGTCIKFSTDIGISGRKHQPFVFYARTAEEAAAIAAALPVTEDTDFLEGKAFAQRLQQLATGNPWTSVTNLIIAANVLAFLLMGLAGAGWFDVASMKPYFEFGANRADLTTDGEWWRLLTCMFLHFGLLHLLFNMWALLQVGHLVERLLGRVLYAIMYLGSGIAGSVASLLWHQHHPVTSAGASGAIFGVYGALLGYMLHEKHALPKSVVQPLLQSTLVFAGYNLFYGLANSGIDNAAHVGGFVGGIALGWLLALPLDPESRARSILRKAGLGLAVTAAYFGLGVAFAPHFSYRLADELAWEEANKDPVAQESKVERTERAALENFPKPGGRATLIQWLDEVGLPFYRDWDNRLRALPLTAGRLTARKRESLARAIELKIASYEHLRAALQRGDHDALGAFEKDTELVNAAAAKLGTLEK